MACGVRVVESVPVIPSESPSASADRVSRRDNSNDQVPLLPFSGSYLFRLIEREKRSPAPKVLLDTPRAPNMWPRPLSTGVPAEILSSSLSNMEKQIQRLESDIKNFPKTDDVQDKGKGCSVALLWGGAPESPITSFSSQLLPASPE
ncbi:unnamed protein product [Boreogadus saida]